MKTPTLSVIIPTYNRWPRLQKCLDLLKAQSTSEPFEVIVVNDGSKDETKKSLNELKKTWKNLQVIHQDNTGQGVARENGLERAKGEVILFIGDDIYAQDGFLEAHLQFHQKHPDLTQTCLGLSEWDPTTCDTRFMKWLTSKRGPQFSYEGLRAGQLLSFWFFYTSNISIKKKLIQKEHFSSAFKGYGWEDIELAYRLETEHKMQLIYEPKALAWHDDPMEHKQLKSRMRQIGKNALVFKALHPDVKVIPSGLKRMILTALSHPAVQLLVKHIKKEWWWYLQSKRYFLEGAKLV